MNQEIAIEDIRIPPDRRAIDPATVAAIAKSFGDVGQRHAITVSAETRIEDTVRREGFCLIAGLHRIEAKKSRNETTILADVVTMEHLQREAWEIDENLCRSELPALERAEALSRRKDIYEMQHPEAKRGAAGGAAKKAKATGGDDPKLTGNFPVSFAADQASKEGVDESGIRREIRRADKIEPDVKDTIRSKPEIANSGSELDALAKLPGDQQRAAVAAVAEGKAKTVRDAAKALPLAPKPVKPPKEKERSEWAIVTRSMVENKKITSAIVDHFRKAKKSDWEDFDRG